jgi:hypothetical protein
MTDSRANHQTQSTEKPQILDRQESNMPGKYTVTVEDVNRVLEVGQLLFSVLKEEEIQELQRILNGVSEIEEIGNAGVT